MRSISSACLILMLRRIELTEGSIKTRSFSLRDIVKGFNKTSLDPLRRIGEIYREAMRTSTYAASTSGLLCLSTTCNMFDIIVIAQPHSN